MRGKASYSLAELAKHINAELRGDGDCRIHGIAGLADAQSGQISFLSGAAYQTHLASSHASAVILEAAQADAVANALVTPTPYLGFAKISQLFDNRPAVAPGIHPTAVVSPDAQLAQDVCVGAYAVIEAGAQVAAKAEIGSGCYLGEGSSLGIGSRLSANVTVHHDVRIGDKVIVHSGAVIGADGFGFAHDGKGWEKIAQLGGVTIGNGVEIGANTTIDRGALSDTIIEEGVKIDNQVMIAHNVKIGAHTAIAACVGISGSAEIGRNCTLAGGVGLVGHIRLADRVHITGMTMVTKSIEEPGSYSSGTPMMNTALWRKNSVRIRQLDELAKRVKALEKQLKELTSTKA